VGILNFFLRSVGIPASKWLSHPASAVNSLILVATWGSGNLIVIFLAGLQNVPAVYHEAAKIDGANSLRRFYHITVPMMTPIIFFNFLMSMVVQLQVFVPAFSITNGGPSEATMFLVYRIQQEGFRFNNFGYASAISFIFFLMVVVITAFIFRFSKNMIFYEGK
jgi:multiple sugar transport system permease protein